MDWEDLRIISSAVRASSLTALARAVGQDPTTAARRMHRAEERLGLALFERRRGSLSLTPEGHRLAEALGDMEAGARAFRRAAQDMNAEPSGTVVVSAPPTIARHIIAPALSDLRAHAPGIQLDLRTEPEPVRIDLMEADLAVRLDTAADEDGDLLSATIGSMDYRVFAPEPGWLGADWIAYPTAFAHVQEAAWVEDRLGGREPILRSNDPVAMAMAVRAGVGRALLAAPVGEAWGLSAEGEPVLRRTLRVLRRKTNGRSATAIAHEWIVKTIGRRVADSSPMTKLSSANASQCQNP